MLHFFGNWRRLQADANPTEGLGHVDTPAVVQPFHERLDTWG